METRPNNSRAALVHAFAVSARLAVPTMLAGLAVVAVLALGPLANAVAQPRGAAADPSWTAASKPAEVIAGRKALMQEAEVVMIPVDAFAAAADGADSQPADLQRAAESVERLLLAFPHLFPPPTNLYDANAEVPVTSALPRVWENFAQFYAMDEAAVRAARALAAATGADEQRAAAAALRGTCDGCHAAYLKPYEPPVVTDADRNVDFDFDFE